MPLQVWLLAIAALLAGAVAARLAGVWFRFRGSGVVTCPETRKPAGVQLDARHAAVTALVKSPDLRLSSCSRWPEHAGCGQACLAQIEAAPQDCLVRNILARWYEGKLCVCCGRQFGEIQWAGQKPALLGPNRISVEWNEIPADKLFVELDAFEPICFACHMANRLVREHPELAIDRSRQAP